MTRFLVEDYSPSLDSAAGFDADILDDDALALWCRAH